MRTVWMAALAGLVLAASASAGKRPDAAIVVCEKGSVLVERQGKKPITVLGAAPLRKGDRVTVNDKGAAALYFADGRVQRLRARETAQITQRRNTPSALAAAWRSLMGRLRARFEAGGQDKTFGTRGDEEDLAIICPRNTRTLPGSIVFEWKPVARARRYKVALLREDGVSVLWQGMTKEPKLAYPEGAPALAPGRTYRWEVSAQMPGGTMPASDLAWFSMLTADEAQEVRQTVTQLRGQLGEAAALPLAAWYADRELYGLAIEALEQECRVERAGPAVHLLLCELYDKTLDFGAARECAERAKPVLAGPERELWAESGR
jgi:hypothetical protein